MQFFRLGWYGRDLLVHTSHQESLTGDKKYIFVFGTYESLQRVEDKTSGREGPFLKIQSCKISVCLALAIL